MPAEFGPVPDLWQALWKLVAQIPPGRVATYGTLAGALGDRDAARWAGGLLTEHICKTGCNCHRVVRSTGDLGLYAAGDAAAKAARLATEGVSFTGNEVDLAQCEFAEFVSDAPLAPLKERQEALLANLSLVPPLRPPTLIAGVDVAYTADAGAPGGEQGCAAYALCDAETGEQVWSHLIRRPVIFPYITGYLAFRELPLYLELLAEVRAANRLADVLLVDGSGVLHARHAGIATHLGIVAGVPTVGISKKRLAGRMAPEWADRLPPPDGSATEVGRTARVTPVAVGEEVVGAAVYSSPRSGRPIFVSPGNGVDLPYALAVVRRTLFGRRLPEPQYWADRASRTPVI